ncbi:hypothetical protein JHK86_016443 [Glycine max]|nr:hypothetical protein JHK86_016443 [Glycine max]
MEQSTNHHNEDIHVEDQTDLSLIVRRLQAQEARKSWQLEANPHEGRKAESSAVTLPRATNLSARQDIIPPSLNTLGRHLLQF